MIVVPLLGLISITFFVYMFYRNNAVYNYRTKILETDPDAYERLPSYDTMLWGYFWVWPLSRFSEE